MTDSSVDIRDVTKRHGATVAVDHLSLKIRKSEFFSILGPSGSGKTTTLRLLAGFEQPDSGEILIEGAPMQGVPPNRRPVNLVFQNYALFPHMTVSENVAFGLEMKGLLPAEVGPRVVDALDMVRLAGADRYRPLAPGRRDLPLAAQSALERRAEWQPLAAAALQGGRVDAAEAYLLLDEPLGALDRQLRQEMEVELKVLQERVGITFVCVTHDQEEALTMSDRLAVLHHGRLLQVGTPEEIYSGPVSGFVANFIGVSNSLSGRVQELHGETVSIAVDGIGVVRSIAPPGLDVGRSVVMTIRPERLRLAHDTGHEDPNDRRNHLIVRVAKAIYSGSDTHYLLTLPNNQMWKAAVQNSESPGKRFSAGEPASLTWSPADAVVLTE